MVREFNSSAFIWHVLIVFSHIFRLTAQNRNYYNSIISDVKLAQNIIKLRDTF